MEISLDDDVVHEPVHKRKKLSTSAGSSNVDSDAVEYVTSLNETPHVKQEQPEQHSYQPQSFVKRTTMKEERKPVKKEPQESAVLADLEEELALENSRDNEEGPLDSNREEWEDPWTYGPNGEAIQKRPIAYLKWNESAPPEPRLDGRIECYKHKKLRVLPVLRLRPDGNYECTEQSECTNVDTQDKAMRPTTSRESRYFKPQYCSNCLEPGHYYSDCPQPARNAILSCIVCASPDHQHDKCTNVLPNPNAFYAGVISPVKISDNDQKQASCCVCGKKGHTVCYDNYNTENLTEYDVGCYAESARGEVYWCSLCGGQHILTHCHLLAQHQRRPPRLTIPPPDSALLRGKPGGGGRGRGHQQQHNIPQQHQLQQHWRAPAPVVQKTIQLPPQRHPVTTYPHRHQPPSPHSAPPRLQGAPRGPPMPARLGQFASSSRGRR